MKKWITLLLTLIMLPELSAQKVYWSDITEDDIDEVKNKTEEFLHLLDKGLSDELNSYISDERVIFSGEVWLNKKQIIDTVEYLTKDRDFNDPEIMAYQFDDFLESYIRNPIIREVYKVFDNHSVLIHIKYKHIDSREDVLLVFQQIDMHWQITGISGFGLPFNDHSGEIFEGNDFKKEKFEEAGVIIHVPSDFSEPDHQANQVNYYLKGESERDAVFQVMIDEPRQRMYFYTYKLVEFNNQHYDMSDLTVRYLPFGIMFEYIVVDPFGIKNKGITVGLLNNGKSVIIQYYSFIEVYQNRKKTIDKVFNNISLD